jgi:hypothetical protein
VGKWREIGTYASIAAEEEERDTFGRTYYSIHVDRCREDNHTHLWHMVCSEKWFLKSSNDEYIHEVSMGFRLDVSMADEACQCSFADYTSAPVGDMIWFRWLYLNGQPIRCSAYG